MATSTCWDGEQRLQPNLHADGNGHLCDLPVPDRSMHGPLHGSNRNHLRHLTSTSGVAPNRIFDIEYRTAYYSGGAGIPLNYEVRLYEGLTEFDVIYGTVPATFTPPAARNLSVGAQRTNVTHLCWKGATRQEAAVRR